MLPRVRHAHAYALPVPPARPAPPAPDALIPVGGGQRTAAPVVVLGAAGAARDRGAADAGRRGTRRDARLRRRVRHDRRARRVALPRRRAQRVRVPLVGDDPRLPLARDGAVMALLLRMDPRPQRARLPRVVDRQPPSRTRSRAGSRGPALDSAVDPRPPALGGSADPPAARTSRSQARRRPPPARPRRSASPGRHPTPIPAWRPRFCTPPPVSPWSSAGTLRPPWPPPTGSPYSRPPSAA